MIIKSAKPINAVTIETDAGSFRVYPFLRVVDVWNESTYDWDRNYNEDEMSKEDFELLINTARKALYHD